MTTASDTPNAEKLRIEVSPNGKWILFDFLIGEGHAFITMRLTDFPDAFESLLRILTHPVLADISGPEQITQGYFSSVAIRPNQYASSITPLGDNVVITYGLPGAVRFPAVFSLHDAKQLRIALDAAILECENREKLTKQ